MDLDFHKKRGQVTIFIILAILIVVAVVAFFMLKQSSVSNLSKELEPAYDYYLSCLNEHARQGASLLGEQGGYIYPQDLEFVPGSSYRPFSSQLDFFGQPVPYWMYVSGNNILTTKKPTKRMMEEDLEKYILENADNCNFKNYYSQGYDISINPDKVTVKINEEDIEVVVFAPIEMSVEDQLGEVSKHKFSIKSKIGKFYDLASKVYDYQMSNTFLESYAIDVMRLYAPVDGTEMTCSPLVFNKQKIKEDLKNALSANIAALKLKGDYYNLAEGKTDYFVTDIGKNLDEQVNFIYSPNWTTNIEIEGDDVVNPVGLQQGMGMLGFCYVPYKFVYDINFPVMIQFLDGDEFFQFPISVIIDKNQPREAIISKEPVSIDSEVCRYKNQKVKISTFDLDLNPVEASLRFKCLSSQCEIGETELINSEEAVYEGMIPQCVNGFILASAEGYANAKKQISSNEETSTSIILKKKFNLTLNLGSVKSALINFNANDYSTAVFYPNTKTVNLVEGYYNISVYAYQDSTLKFPGSKEQKCVEVPVSGVGSLLGLSTEQCFDVTLPEMEIDSAIVGGGKTEEYITQSQLENSKELKIEMPLFPLPKSLEELQQNTIALKDTRIYIDYE